MSLDIVSAMLEKWDCPDFEEKTTCEFNMGRVACFLIVQLVFPKEHELYLTHC